VIEAIQGEHPGRRWMPFRTAAVQKRFVPSGERLCGALKARNPHAGTDGEAGSSEKVEQIESFSRDDV
jgi:hypothetical protein